jgi:hypothetical protein
MKRLKKPSKGVDRMARLKKLFPSGPVKGDIRDVIEIERS